MFASFVAWLKNPLNDGSGTPSAYTLFLFVGLLLIMVAAWGLIFRQIREAV